jgi:hypothetical protein
MKKQLRFGIFALILSCLCAACDREKEPLSATEQQAANAGTLPPDGNYIPFIYGSKWAYDDGASVDTTYLTRDTMLNGKAYKEFFSSAGVYYMRYADKVYYRLEANPLIATDATGMYERIALRTDLGISTKYEQKFNLLSSGYVRTETLLMNILKERYVKGKKYNTVLEVITRFYIKNPLDDKETSVGTAYEYYGKDKGLIELIETGGGKRLTYFNY